MKTRSDLRGELTQFFKPQFNELARADFRRDTFPKVNETVVTYKETGEAAKKLIEHVDSKVDPAVEKYNTVATKTGDMMDSVRDMVGPSAKDWKGTIADLHEITTNLKTELPKMMDKVQGSLDSAKAGRH